MNSQILGIGSYLPENRLTNDQIQKEHPDWEMQKILEKCGIRERRISSQQEFSLELGIKAGENLLSQNIIDSQEIDFVIFCSQMPKHLITVNSSILQDKLKLSNRCGTLDINLGCSGYSYCLILADTFISQNLAKNVLIITADTLSKIVDKNCKQTRTMFGDAATATLVSQSDRKSGIIAVEWGSDGSGSQHIGSSTAGMQGLCERQTVYTPDLHMDGGSVLNFMLKTVPDFFEKLLHKSTLNLDDIDHVVFHQANKFILNSIREKLKIPQEKFHLNMELVGNTSSSSIPLMLQELMSSGKIMFGQKVIFAGFGTGLSWSSLIYQW